VSTCADNNILGLDDIQARSSLAPQVLETLWAAGAMTTTCKIRDGSMLIHRVGGQDASEVIKVRPRTLGPGGGRAWAAARKLATCVADG
jgi:hypothetical protein